MSVGADASTQSGVIDSVLGEQHVLPGARAATVIDWRSGLPPAKRVVDGLMALVALIVLAPVLVLIALAVRISSPGPVLFRHERVGRHGNPFTCLKFRTMVEGADRMLVGMLATDERLRQQFEADFKLSADPRVTRIGRWLRRTSLDELPQFWNVLKGDMSVVGPRPVVDAELERYGESVDLVFGLRPGITGLWQVSGRNDLDYPARVALDVTYARTNCLRQDLVIMVRTAWLMVAIRRNGAR